MTPFFFFFLEKKICSTWNTCRRSPVFNPCHPFSSQCASRKPTALPYETRRLIPLCKTTLSGQKFYSGTCARMSCLISAEVRLQSRGRERERENLCCVNGAGFAADTRESNRGRGLFTVSGHTHSFSPLPWWAELSSAPGVGRSVGRCTDV